MLLLCADNRPHSLSIADNRWTATQVITLFIRESKRAHAATNALTEVMYASALRRAGTLDADFARTGELVGPLHGVPVSLKEWVQATLMAYCKSSLSCLL